MNIIRNLALTFFAATATIGGSTTTAKAFDIDCAVLLCMAGGFPSEPTGICAAAKAYMIARVTPIPVLPPFGICTFPGFNISLGQPSGTTETYIPDPNELDFLNALAIDFGTRQSTGGGRSGNARVSVTLQRCHVEGGNTQISGSGSGCPTAFNASELVERVCLQWGGRSQNNCLAWSAGGPARLQAQWSTANVGGPMVGSSRGIRIQYEDQDGIRAWTEWVYY